MAVHFVRWMQSSGKENASRKQAVKSAIASIESEITKMYRKTALSTCTGVLCLKEWRKRRPTLDWLLRQSLMCVFSGLFRFKVWLGTSKESGFLRHKFITHFVAPWRKHVVLMWKQMHCKPSAMNTNLRFELKVTQALSCIYGVSFAVCVVWAGVNFYF